MSLASLAASHSNIRQDIRIEVAVGGFILEYTDLNSTLLVREVHVSQRKLLNRLKTIIADSSLVPETKDDSED